MVGDGDAPRFGLRTEQYGNGVVERGGERFRFLARGAVDDAGFVGMIGHVACNPRRLVFGVEF